MFAEQVLRMAAGLFVGIWVARYLGPVQFGLFSYAVAFAALFSSIAKLGLDSIVVRDLVHDAERRDTYMSTAFWLKLIGAVAMLAMVIFVLQFTDSDSTTKLYICIIASGAVFQSAEVIDFYYQSRVLSRYVSVCRLAQLVISSLIKLCLIYIESDLFWFVLVSLVDQVTLAVTLYLSYRYQKFDIFLACFDTRVAIRMLRDSWPLMLSGLVIMVYMRIDQIMIKELLGDREVGVYSAATRLSEIWYFIPVILTNALFPAIINAKNTNGKLYLERLQLLYLLMVWVAVAIALPMTIFGDRIIILLFGREYSEAASVLRIQVWAGVFVFLGVASSNWFVIENQTKLSFRRTFYGMLVNVVLNSILIPKYGIQGAATASVLGNFTAAFVIDLFSKETRPVFYMKLNALIPVYFMRRKV